MSEPPCVIVQHPDRRLRKPRLVAARWDVCRQTLTVQPERGPGIDYPLSAIRAGGPDLGPEVGDIARIAQQQAGQWVSVRILSANIEFTIDGWTPHRFGSSFLTIEPTEAPP